MSITNKAFTGEISLMTFSLILGLMFWAIVKQQETLNQTILVPVSVTNLPEFIEVESFEPSNLAVKFSLRAGDETLARDPGRFRINMDLGVLRNRVAISENFLDYPLDITRDMLEFPERLTFSSFDDSPARVIIRVRPRIARVPITVNLTNADSPAEGYRVEVENVLVEPSEVLLAVDEPRYLLALAGQLRVTTEPVDLRGRRDQVSGLYALALGSEQGVFPLPGQAVPSVEVIIPIPEMQGRRVFEGIPIRYETLAVGVRAVLDPPTATVTVEGPQSIVSRLGADDIRLLPRPVAFLDEETVGEIVDTSIDVRFADRIGADAEKLRPPVVTPGLVKISFVASAPPPQETPSEGPTDEPAGVPEEEEIDDTDDVLPQLGVDPLGSNQPLEPPSRESPAQPQAAPDGDAEPEQPEQDRVIDEQGAESSVDQEPRDSEDPEEESPTPEESTEQTE